MNPSPSGFQGHMGDNTPLKSNMEVMMEIFIICQTKQNNELKTHNMRISEVMNKLVSKVDSIVTHTKMPGDLNLSIYSTTKMPSYVSFGTFPG